MSTWSCGPIAGVPHGGKTAPSELTACHTWRGRLPPVRALGGVRVVAVLHVVFSNKADGLEQAVVDR